MSLVSGSYFSVLGVRAAIGRTLTADDDRVPGGHPVAVISDRYWTRRFARAPDVLERTFTLHGTTFTILGVASHGFSGDWIGQPVDLWIPMAMQSQVMPEETGLLDDHWGTGASWVRVVARLQPGVQVKQAEAAATLIFQQFLREQSCPSASNSMQDDGLVVDETLSRKLLEPREQKALAHAPARRHLVRDHLSHVLQYFLQYDIMPALCFRKRVMKLGFASCQSSSSDLGHQVPGPGYLADLVARPGTLLQASRF